MIGRFFLIISLACFFSCSTQTSTDTQEAPSTLQSSTTLIGVGAPSPADAEVHFDGTREMLDAKWTYWESPRLAAELPIKWQIVEDPIDAGTAMSSNDPAAAGGLYGAADIVTHQKFRDFRAHVEFLIQNPGGNSGVYLQNRYEIQVLDGGFDKAWSGSYYQ